MERAARSQWPITGLPKSPHLIRHAMLEKRMLNGGE
jgi:hypothetical protein